MSGLCRISFCRDTLTDFTLLDLVAWLCPAFHADINTIDNGASAIAVQADDWKALEPLVLINRISPPAEETSERLSTRRDLAARRMIEELAVNMRPLISTDGAVVGRAFIVPERHDIYMTGVGVVTVGGLRASSLHQIIGICEGTALTAARDEAFPVIDLEGLKRWASEQATLVDTTTLAQERRIDIASIVNVCGGETGSLPIARDAYGWLSVSSLTTRWAAATEALLLQDASAFLEEREAGPFEIDPNVIVVEMGQPVIVSAAHNGFSGEHWPRIQERRHQSLEDLVIASLAAAWNQTEEATRSASSFSTDHQAIERVVGRRRANEITKSVDLIRRPP